MTTADVALAVVETESPLPVYSGKQMADALVAYKDLQASLDRAMPDQIIRLDDKPFRKKGYWRAVAVAFNLAVECVSETRDVFGALEGGAENYGYRVTYRASTKGGRSSVGDGTCTAAEKQRGRMRATEHNVRSHAHTRALNRAIANLVAFGEVSAEEIEDPPEPAPKSQPRPVKPAATAHLKPPARFLDWMVQLQKAASQGETALREFWDAADPASKKFLRDSDPDGWMTIKQKAAKVSAAAAAADHDDAS